MSDRYPCPNCHAPNSNPWSPCPTCAQSDEAGPEAFVPATSPRGWLGGQGSGGGFVLAGYVSFVLIPILLTIGFFYWYFHRPALVEAEKNAPPSTQTPVPGQKPKTKPPPNSTPRPGPVEPPSVPQPPPPDGPVDADLRPPTNDPKPTSEFEIAPQPRAIKVYGTLRLTTKIAVKDGVQAWVEIDGKKEKDWGFGKTQVKMKLEAGSHAVRVISVYKGTRTVYFEGEIEVPDNKLKEASVDPAKQS